MTSRVIVRNKGKRPEFFSEGFTLVVIIHTHSYPPALKPPSDLVFYRRKLDPGRQSITGLKLRVRTSLFESKSPLQRLHVPDSVEGSWAYYGSYRPTGCSLVPSESSSLTGAFTP